ncbi:ES1 protein homolog, mitochondrial-like [Stylophora pistillata]|uniref:ES1 protein homolog, mitochondrial-like n=1 Tax=Stylophora pistillata TaxID=50429 RepID=UPI000C055236|nr:ES1 protein homolog, mitochondrial-like [Stylophora pistillata]
MAACRVAAMRTIARCRSFQTYRAFSTGSTSRASVAVVLSGNGVFDGAEIHEASAVLVHLSRAGADVSIYAPDIPQMHVLNHAKGEEMEGETRNVLVESARIARGKITSLANLDAASHDAVVFPGGFGAAKNLSSFAVDGAGCTVNEEVAKCINNFHAAKKPIGLCCISPVLAAKLIPGVEITVGQDKDDGGRWPYAGTADAVQQMGAKHINKDVNEIHVDQQNKVVTTPAFMCETKVHEIHDGIGKMVEAIVKMV